MSEYRDTTVNRRFLQVDDRYLVVADHVAGSGGSLSWMLHGNGGGTSGGAFESTPAGGRWQIGGARLDAAIAVAGGPPVLDTVEAIHEVPYGQERTHTALRATVPAGSADAVQVLYPSRASAAPPAMAVTSEPGVASVVVTDVAEDRRVVVTRSAGSAAGATVVDEHLDGRLRVASADHAGAVTHGPLALTAATPGMLGIRLEDGSASVVADTGDPEVELAGLPFTPAVVDGACAATVEGGRLRITLNRERRVRVRAAGGNARPAADAGPFQRVDPGSLVTLDGSASCDAEGGALVPSWELVSAPAGSSWTFTGADTFAPQLVADRVGPYRVRLTVTDPEGATSLEQEVLVIAGPRCGDGVDNDLDGLIDTDDGADCDGVDPEPPEPTTTTTTTTTTSTTTTSTTTGSTTTTAAPPGPDDPPTMSTSEVGPAPSTSPAPGRAALPAVPPAPVAVAVRAGPRFTG